MNIQSISIVVPTKGCVNNCKFCVSRMHDNTHLFESDLAEMKNRMMKRIKWAVMNNVNTCILTGSGEVLQNKNFLEHLCDIFYRLNNPFPNVEVQTTGVMLDVHAYRLFKELGVNTISLSISDIFSDSNNLEIIEVPEKLKFNLERITKTIKSQGFNVRYSLNLTNVYDDTAKTKIFARLCHLSPDQVTFRKLWSYGDNILSQSIWVEKNKCKESTYEEIKEYIEATGKPLYRLPFGAMAYSILEMSTVIDDNCMSKNDVDKLKYVILREDGRLYCQWDDKGSLIF